MFNLLNLLIIKKHFLLLLLVLGSVIAASTADPAPGNITATRPFADSVILCNSGTAYAYHSRSNCSGLNRCTHGLIKVSLNDAVKKYGRRACERCW